MVGGKTSFAYNTEECSEETLLYQIISGIHGSINMHVSHNFHETEDSESRMNHQLFLNMIGFHEDRLKNLYFLFSLVLRAINRAEPILRAYNYNTDLDP